MRNKPLGLQTVTLKHMASDAHNCRLEWKADFSSMEILLYTPIISPALLLEFIVTLPHQNDWFEKNGVTTALQISDRFKIKLCVIDPQNGVAEVWYRLRVYQLNTGSEKLDRLEIELFPSV